MKVVRKLTTSGAGQLFGHLTVVCLSETSIKTVSPVSNRSPSLTGSDCVSLAIMVLEPVQLSVFVRN